ncbi:rRNA (cytidine-2'-O-)-methyltransferase, partial [Candidatus Gracilibacteria bacterium]|nr:rRNA (cytidine-2'-O-)-methyltransferase [Candidatus Gracilibacteria bacterium]
VARELTKKFEEFNRVTIKEAIEIYSKKEKQKGEFVIVI